MKICTVQVSSSEMHEIKLHCLSPNEVLKMLVTNIQLYLILWYILFWALTLLWFVLGAMIWPWLGLSEPRASKEIYQGV